MVSVVIDYDGDDDDHVYVYVYSLLLIDGFDFLSTPSPPAYP